MRTSEFRELWSASVLQRSCPKLCRRSHTQTHPATARRSQKAGAPSESGRVLRGWHPLCRSSFVFRHSLALCAPIPPRFLFSPLGSVGSAPHRRCTARAVLRSRPAVMTSPLEFLMEELTSDNPQQVRARALWRQLRTAARRLCLCTLV